MYRHIVVALDGSHCADRALEQATALAKLADARLTLLHIANLRDLAVENVQMFDNSRLHEMAHQLGDAILDEAEARVREHGVDKVERFVGESWDGGREMARALVGFATEHAADLIVMGTHGRTGLMHLLLGSFAETVLQESPVPLLIARGIDDESKEHSHKRPVM
ncbi:universal stress protein [Crenobacter sp. SG2303]|uniref:Universal stress protein n=1 Tax=Crenobacter oryzisoli TaxID=3056844 RepID=A0ABT7XMQ6_9NEIS|nr:MULTISPECIES: universal stress protein [unclassified Crenobacter]MDN0075055.1 universal stress protein [Crenobacter sp. SG2303]MDN0081161.1 universal stress protein [Crenobacter sp. SG2305]